MTFISKRLEKDRIICSIAESYATYENAITKNIKGIFKPEFLLEGRNQYMEVDD
jgi:hypothetical protein